MVTLKSVVLCAALAIWSAAKVEAASCSPACKNASDCFCTYDNGATCADDHPVYGTCRCKCVDGLGGKKDKKASPQNAASGEKPRLQCVNR